MSADEQMAVIGRMVVESKQLQQKEAALVDEVSRASKEFQSLSGLLANYKSSGYVAEMQISDEAARLVNVEKIISLVGELLTTRQELSELKSRLDKI